MGNMNQRSYVADLRKTIFALVEAIFIELIQPNSFMNKTAAYKLTECLQLSLPPTASHAGPLGVGAYELDNLISTGTWIL